MSHEPKIGTDKHTCPHCSVLAQQTWLNNDNLQSTIFSLYDHAYLNYRSNIQSYSQEAISNFLSIAKGAFSSLFSNYFSNKVSVATCKSCGKCSLWIGNDMVYPRNISIEPPNQDLNESVRALYREAALIFTDSPKGSAALLRLALHYLLLQIGRGGKKIDDDIKELVEGGLNPTIQQALDILWAYSDIGTHPIIHGPLSILHKENHPQLLHSVQPIIFKRSEAHIILIVL